jgi:hypothetical protein
MPLGKRIFDFLFACRHRHQGRLMTVQRQTYRVCLDCGAHLRYSWQAMASVDEPEPLYRTLVLRIFHFARQKILHAMSR